MSHDRWTAADSQERRDRIKDADTRLDAWARWSRLQPGVGGASSSNWFMALGAKPDEEGQAGAKHVAAGCPDEEAMEVDGVVASWMIDEPWYWKVARYEYLHGGTQDLKANRLGISKAFYRQLLDELRTVLWRELDLLSKKSTKRGKLDELPARNART